ncbi:MAG: PhoH family protein [Bacteroidota bacterium]
MSEKIIEIEGINPIQIYGINDSRLSIIQRHHPKLKLIARGSTLKLIGSESDIENFSGKLDKLTDHLQKYSSISEIELERIIGDGTVLGEEGAVESFGGEDVLVFGNNGLVIKARTENQRLLVKSVLNNDMVFALGPAGTGKTYTAVALAVRALKNKEVKRIILTRPAVEAGENLGFLPGDLKEKLDPYLQPLFDALRDMLPAEKLVTYLEAGTIQIAPLAFMRGRTLDNAFVILDEAQNATKSQMKMFLTRMGRTAKFVITGDVTQVDLPKNQPSGLVEAIHILKGIKGIDFIHLNADDVIRHRLVKAIINAYDQENRN